MRVKKRGGKLRKNFGRWIILIFIASILGSIEANARSCSAVRDYSSVCGGYLIDEKPGITKFLNEKQDCLNFCATVTGAKCIQACWDGYGRCKGGLNYGECECWSGDLTTGRTDTSWVWGGICEGTGCAPKTCSILSKSCGSWDNGCGGTINCGSCNSGYSCVNGACQDSCLSTNCNDGNSCTSDSCSVGKCSHATLGDGTNCGGNGKCRSGKCVEPIAVGNVGVVSIVTDRGTRTIPMSIRFAGCFNDQPSRALPISLGTSDVSGCVSWAYNSGYKYIGMQNNGGCWVGGSSYGKYGEKSCSGNVDGNGFYLGGAWENAVYMIEGMGTGIEPAPDITSFSVSPNSVNAGEKRNFVISWRSSSTGSCKLDGPESGLSFNGIGQSGSSNGDLNREAVFSSSGSKDFILTCYENTNGGGRSTSKTFNAQVNCVSGSCGAYSSTGYSREGCGTRTCNDGCGNFRTESKACSVCAPASCAGLGKSCGSWSDSCGGTLNCRSCEAGIRCNSGICEVLDIGSPYVKVSKGQTGNTQCSNSDGRVCVGEGNRLEYYNNGQWIADSSSSCDSGYYGTDKANFVYRAKCCIRNCAERCGTNDDGCGGKCTNEDSNTCGKCGNLPCLGAAKVANPCGYYGGWNICKGNNNWYDVEPAVREWRSTGACTQEEWKLQEYRTYSCGNGNCNFVSSQTKWEKTGKTGNKPDKTPCDDGNVCSKSDMCISGQCSGTIPNGDINKNGGVDVGDYTLFSKCFNSNCNSPSSGCSAQQCADSDFNGDNQAVFQDFLCFADRYKVSCTSRKAGCSDSDGNGVADFQDLVRFSKCFGKSITESGCFRFDYNLDGAIDGNDFVCFQSDFDKPVSCGCQRNVGCSDSNKNGLVDYPDYVAFAGCFGSATSSKEGCYIFDYNLDKQIGNNDFYCFAEDFGKSADCRCDKNRNSCSDSNRDGRVDFQDYVQLANCFGKTASGGCANFDYNSDNMVSQRDFYCFTEEFGISTKCGNRAPTANPVSISINEDSSGEITLNCPDPDGDAVTYSINSKPAYGGLSPISPIVGNKVIYTPNSNYYGSDTFTYKCNDKKEDSNIGTVSINVAPVNDPPNLIGIPNKFINEDEDPQDNWIDLNLYAQDIDAPAGLTFSIQSQSNPSLISCHIASNRYVNCLNPSPDKYGYSDISVMVSDGSLSAYRTFRIDVKPANDAPTAAIRVEGNCQVGNQIKLKCSASDVDGSISSVRLWAGECSVKDGCQATSSWTTKRGKTYYNDNSMELEGKEYIKTFTIEQPTGTGIAAACLARDNNGVDSNPGNGYPVCVVGTLCSINQNPIFTFKEITPNPAKEGEVTIKFTSSKPLAGYPNVIAKPDGANKEYRVDYSSGPTADNQYIYKFKIEKGYENGKWVVKAKGSDSNNCVGENEGFFTIDTTPPQGGSISYTDGYIASPSVSIFALDGVDSSGISTSRRKLEKTEGNLRGDCGEFGIWEAIAYSGNPPTLTTPAQNGKCYRYRWRVSDNAGNEQSYSVAKVVKVDTSPPSTSIISTQPFDTWAKFSASVTLTCSDTESGPSVIKYCISSSNGCDPTRGSAYISPFIVSAEGMNYVRYFCTDNAGNPENVNSKTVLIDKKEPSGSISINDGAEYTTSASALLKLKYADNNDNANIAVSGVKECRYSNSESNGWSGWERCSSARSWDLSSGDGLKTAYYEIKDNAGNAKRVSDSIILDSSPPTITSAGPTAFQASTDITLTAATNENANCRYSNSDIGYEGMQYPFLDGKGTSSHSARITANRGVNNYYIRCEDMRGRKMENSFNLRFTVNSFPTAESFSISTNEDSQTQLGLRCSDIDGDRIRYFVVSGPHYGYLSGGGDEQNQRTYTPNPNYNGPDFFIYTCNDGKGDGNTATAKIDVIPVNDAPTVEPIIIEGNCQVGNQIKLKCSASDVDGSISSVRLWAGECSVKDGCQATSSWTTKRGKTYYNDNSMELEGKEYIKTFTIEQPTGTGIAAACLARDNNGADSNWGNGYPVCGVGSECSRSQNPNFVFQEISPNPAKEGEMMIKFSSSKRLAGNPSVSAMPYGSNREYPSVYSSGPTADNQYIYKFNVEKGYENGKWLVKVKGSDNNNCAGENDELFTIDTTPPQGGSISYKEGYSNSREAAITANIGEDKGSGIKKSVLERRETVLSRSKCGDYGSWSTISPSGAYPSLTDSIESGKCYQYRLIVYDNANNYAEYSVGKELKADTKNPSSSASFVISLFAMPSAFGAEYLFGSWTNANVDVTLACSDEESGASVIKYCIDNTNGCDPIRGGAYSSPFTVSAEGMDYVRYFCTDNAGNPENVNSKTVLIDKKEPSGAISINGGAEYATSSSVQLGLEYSDVNSNIAVSGVKECRYSNSKSSGWSGWETCAGAKSWDLLSENLLRGDGLKTVYYEIKDNAGKVKQLSDSIMLDSTPPSTSAGPTTFQASTSVTLTAATNENARCRHSTANVGYASMSSQFSNGEGATSHSTQITAARGVNNYYVSCEDVRGVDMKAAVPVSFSVNNLPRYISGVESPAAIFNPGETITLRCDFSDADQDTSTLDVKFWIGACEDETCSSRDWGSPGLNKVPKDGYDSQGFYKNFKIPSEWAGKKIAATCNAYDRQNADAFDSAGVRVWSADRYPLASVNNPPIISNVKDFSKEECRSGSVVKIKCDTSDADVADSSQLPRSVTVKGWLGTCTDKSTSQRCFDTRVWNVFDSNGVTMNYKSGNEFESPSAALNFPIGTAIVATCQAKDSNNAESNWGDRYSMCTIGECVSNPKFENIETYQNNEKKAEVKEGLVEIKFTADRDLDDSRKPTVKIVRKNGDRIVAQYDAAYSSKSGRSYVYTFTVRKEYTAWNYDIVVSAKDANNCDGGSIGALKIGVSPIIKINGKIGDTIKEAWEEGTSKDITLEWDVNLESAEIVFYDFISNNVVERLQGKSGSQTIMDLESGSYVAKLYDTTGGRSVPIPVTNAIIDITGFLTESDTEWEWEHRVGQVNYEAEEESWQQTVPADPTTPTLVSANSIYIKMDVSNAPDELWNFKWKKEHFKEGGKGSNYGSRSDCGLWLVEEDGGLRSDNKGWTIVKQGSIIKRSGNSIIAKNSIPSSNLVRCERDSDDVCQILYASFNTNLQRKCSAEKCALADYYNQYKPKGDILCAASSDGKGIWYLCNKDGKGAEKKVGETIYFCKINDGEDFGEWLPREDCNTQGDDDKDNKVNCADEECYGTDDKVIRVKAGETIGEHELGADPSKKAYYHPKCNPDEKENVCKKENLIPDNKKKLSDFLNQRPVYAYESSIIQKCCGDDEEDVGLNLDATKRFLCYVDSASSPTFWMDATKNKGIIIRVNSNNNEYLSIETRTGAQWEECDGAFKLKTTKENKGDSEHSYICTKDKNVYPTPTGFNADAPKNTFVECCGEIEGDCFTGTEGTTLTNGGYVIENSKIYYCRNDGKFVADLDVKYAGDTTFDENKETCGAIILPKANPGEQDKHPTWTGTKCCGEPAPDDPNEFYNDPIGAAGRITGSNIGGCWNSNYMQINKPFANEKVININGEFLGCNLDATKRDEETLLNIGETGTANNIIKKGTPENNKQYCSKAGSNPYYICSFKDRWKSLESHSKDTHINQNDEKESQTGYASKEYGLSDHPITATDKECCPSNPSNECWNGNNCMELNSEFDDNGNKDDGVYLCKPDGQKTRWIVMHPKIPLKGGDKGYCDTDNQCLVSNDQTESPKCINAGEYYKIKNGGEIIYGDNFCENGEWTSRTKYIAAQLARIAEDANADYTLYCDSADKVLNSFIGADEKTSVNFNDFNGLTTSNVCVLKKKTSNIYEIAIGFALNKEVAQLNTQIKQAFGNDISCTRDFTQLGTTDRFHQCKENDNRLWYNEWLNAMIYSRAGIESRNIEGVARSSLVLVDPPKKITAPMQPLLDRIPNAHPKYNYLYISKINNKNIYGFLEPASTGNQYNYLGVMYDQAVAWPKTICVLANAKAKNGLFEIPTADDIGRLHCVQRDGKEFVLSIIQPELIGLKYKNYFINAFADLTAKLRAGQASSGTQSLMQRTSQTAAGSPECDHIKLMEDLIRNKYKEQRVRELCAYIKSCCSSKQSDIVCKNFREEACIKTSRSQ